MFRTSFEFPARPLAVAVAACALVACTEANPAYVPGSGGDGSTIARDAASRRDTRSLPGPDLGDGSSADSAAPPPVDSGLVTPDQRQTSNKAKGVDVLLVVDNSGGMSAAQQKLARDIDAMLGALSNLPGGASYRIGIVTTDLGVGAYARANCTARGDAGRLFVQSSCPNRPSGASYVQNIGGKANVKGSVDRALQCLVQVGTRGCGFEQPLEAMRTALGTRGFLRKSAALAVIILTNEDDCSAAYKQLYDPTSSTFGPYSSYRCFRFGVLCNGQRPPLSSAKLRNCAPGQKWLHALGSRYVTYLKQLKPAGWLSVLVLSGPVDPVLRVTNSGGNTSLVPTCTTSSLSADPGVRLGVFGSGFGSSGSRVSICNSSYRAALSGAINTLRSAFR